MVSLLCGLVLFLGMHSVSIVSRAWRDTTAARLGPGAWRLVYSLVSLIGFYLIIRGYGLARIEPAVLYVPPQWGRHAAALLMLPVFPFLVAAYLPGRIKALVKHPMLTATAFWALAHVVANGTLADALLFGGFLVWALADRVAVARRPVPVRPMSGASSQARGWGPDAIAVVAGLAIYALFIGWAHVPLFGVSPLP